MTDTIQTQLAKKRPRRMAREPKADGTGPTFSAVSPLTINDVAPKPQTKASLVEMTLAREDGASLDELYQATGWLLRPSGIGPHR